MLRGGVIMIDPFNFNEAVKAVRSGQSITGKNV
jgi:hypothetical protein